jgi:aminoglycoside phosphotransferase (APT) family kinase protein
LQVGSIVASRWMRVEPRRRLDDAVLSRIIHAAFPGRGVAHVQPLFSCRNANFLVQLDGVSDSIVLCLFEHDPSICRKQLDLYRVIDPVVPLVPVLYAEPEGLDDIPPFLITQFVSGISFCDLLDHASLAEIQQAASEVGRVLASIARTQFRQGGWIGPGPTVAAPLLAGEHLVANMVDECLAADNVRKRLGPELCRRLSRIVWSFAGELTVIDDAHNLVHSDFGPGNTLVRYSGAKWEVSAVLDWEFAFSGSPLVDIGHFLRFEDERWPLVEPGFSRGFLEGGGMLPENWRMLSRIADIVSIGTGIGGDLREDSIRRKLDVIGSFAENFDL